MFFLNRAESLLVLGSRQSGASSCTGRSILSYRTEGSGPWWAGSPGQISMPLCRGEGAGGYKVRLCGIGAGGAVSLSHTCLFVGPSRLLPFFSV